MIRTLSVSEKQIDKMIIYSLAGYNSLEISAKLKLPHDPVKSTLEYIFTHYGDYIDQMAEEFYKQLD